MRLLSDHEQWYDRIFDDRGREFHRRAFTRGGLKKREQLELFDRIGLRTPPHGTVRSLAGTISREQRCVVYEDELEHRGRGKVLLSLDEAERTHPDFYATLFVPTDSKIVRHVRFGRIGFWIEQRSRFGDWRSNIDDEERLLARSFHLDSPIPRVLWAIDFLPTSFGLLAIDFNTAPELVTIGEASAASEDELASELERASEEELRQL